MAGADISVSHSNRHVGAYDSAHEVAGHQQQVTEVPIRYERASTHIVSLAK
jgi:hypothetical protein